MRTQHTGLPRVPARLPGKPSGKAAQAAVKGQRAIATGALLMAVGIGIGALGAHALRDALTERQLQSLQPRSTTRSSTLWR